MLGYQALKLLAKWIVPRLFRYALKKTGEQFTAPGSYQNSDNRSYETGKTTLVKNTVRKTKPSKKVGEYIDFEEIN